MDTPAQVDCTSQPIMSTPHQVDSTLHPFMESPQELKDVQRSGFDRLLSRISLVDEEYYRTEAKSNQLTPTLRLADSKEYYTWWSGVFLENAKKANIGHFFVTSSTWHPAFRLPAPPIRPDLAALKPRDIMAGESDASYKAYYDAACKHAASIADEYSAAQRKHSLLIRRYESALRTIEALVEWPLLEKIIGEGGGATTQSIWRDLQIHFDKAKPRTREDAKANIEAVFTREFKCSTSA